MAKVPSLEATHDEVREVLAPLRNRFSVAMYSCQNAFAVGAIIRVAHNFLAREIVIVGADTYYEKASMGMEKYETIVRVADAEAFFAHAGRRPVWAVEKDYARQSIYSVSAFPDDVVLLFGSERDGIPRDVIDRTSHVIGIPIYGVNHSLPVTVAAGIVMSEWARRRYPNGVVV